MSWNKSEDNTRHRAFMFMHYVHTHTHTHEPTHTPTHKSAPGLALPCLYSSSGKQKGLSPSHASLQVLSQPREKVGKECQASDDREVPTDRAEIHSLHTEQGVSLILFFLLLPFWAQRRLSCAPRNYRQALLVAASPIFADSAALRLLLCPLFPWPFRRLLAFLCCCSADTLRPAAAVAALLDASIRLRGLSPRPIQAGVGNLPRHT
jgi:hypothetical protein